MEIQMGDRGNGKTYRLVMQLLINNGIFITRTSKQAKYINEIILPEAIKYLKEETNREYDCKEIAFCIDNFTTKSKKNKPESNFMDEMIASYAHSLKSSFEVSTISGKFCNHNYNVDKNSDKGYLQMFQCIWNCLKKN